MLWVFFCLLSDKKFIPLDALYFSPVNHLAKISLHRNLYMVK